MYFYVDMAQKVILFMKNLWKTVNYRDFLLLFFSVLRILNISLPVVKPLQTKKMSNQMFYRLDKLRSTLCL